MTGRDEIAMSTQEETVTDECALGTEIAMPKKEGAVIYETGLAGV